MEVMGAHAACKALAGGPAPDLILNASTTPRQVIPDSSIYIQNELKLKDIPSYSVHATCLSFIVALHTAAAYVASNAYRRILIVSSECGTISRDFKEPESASLLGDGAAAVVVEPTPEGENSALLSFRMRTWPKGAALTELRGGGMRCHPNDPNTRPEDNLFHMNGPAVYKMARRQGALIIRDSLKDAGMTSDDVDLVVPHQASGGALESITRYGFPKEKIVNVIAEYGNCIAASTPMALDVAHQEGRLKRGSIILIGGTGAGLSAAVALLRW
jgi:3-oxoacyl-[acyl-carrier-protein] synthase-3